MSRSHIRTPILRELEALILDRRDLPSLRLQRLLRGIRDIDEVMVLWNGGNATAESAQAQDDEREGEHNGESGTLADAGGAGGPAGRDLSVGSDTGKGAGVAGGGKGRGR